MTCAPITAVPLDATPIHLVDEAGVEPLLARLGEGARVQATAQAFAGRPGQVLVVLGAAGSATSVLCGVRARAAGGDPIAAALRGLAAELPPADYVLADGGLTEAAAVAWALGGYGFHRYKAARGRELPRLCVGGGVEVAQALRVAEACALARDMVNTPANDMGPAGDRGARARGRRAARRRRRGHDRGGAARRRLSGHSRRGPGRRAPPRAAADRDGLARA